MLIDWLIDPSWVEDRGYLTPVRKHLLSWTEVNTNTSYDIARALFGCESSLFTVNKLVYFTTITKETVKSLTAL